VGVGQVVEDEGAALPVGGIGETAFGDDQRDTRVARGGARENVQQAFRVDLPSQSLL
jgi:hypothetical protein